MCAHVKLLTDSTARQELVCSVLKTPLSGPAGQAGASVTLALP